MQKIIVTETFPFSVDVLFSYLKVHENLESLFFPLKVKTVKKGENEKFGIGSVRQLSLGIVPPFEETITAYKKNELIEYKITKGSPLKNHKGTMVFSSTNSGSQLKYSIEFESPIPLLASLVKMNLEKGIKKGLKTLKENGS